MATVLWPTSAEIIRQDLRLEFPGQIVLQTEITGHVQVIDRGYGLWRGNCLIGLTPEGAEIEGFLSSLAGARNLVEMPLHRPTIESNAEITAVAGNSYTLDSRPEGLVLGAFIRNQFGCYQITTLSTGNTPTISIEPAVPIAIGQEFSPAPTMRVRATDQPPLSPRNPSWWGPWSLSFQETRVE